MKKIINKKAVGFLAIVTTLTILASSFVFAADDIQSFIEQLTGTIRSIAVGIIALSAVIVAVLFMLGAANPKWKAKSKDAMYALIVGVVILVLSGDIANWVANISGKDITTWKHVDTANNIDHTFEVIDWDGTPGDSDTYPDCPTHNTKDGVSQVTN